MPIPDAKRVELSQYLTPSWAAEVLFDAHFSHLGPRDLVWEPACGAGNMLSAIPAHIPAIGTDIDADMVTRARQRTGRPVFHGDCRTVTLPSGISAIFGNPPFELSLFEQMLERSAV